MVSGCFSWHRVGGIYLISETMAKEVFDSMLEEVMLTFASEEMSSFNNIITLNNTPGQNQELGRAKITFASWRITGSKPNRKSLGLSKESVYETIFNLCS